MKLLEEILNKVRSLPEGVRKLAFIFCSVAAVVVVFNVWMGSVSHKLGAIDGTGGGKIVSQSSLVAKDLENESLMNSGEVEKSSVQNELLAQDATEGGLVIEGPLVGIADSIKSMGEFVAEYKLPMPEKEAVSSFFSSASAKITDILGAGGNYLNDFYGRAQDWAAKNILGIKIGD